jgi:ABC-type lipoprotein release transport system permease subunit
MSEFLRLHLIPRGRFRIIVFGILLNSIIFSAAFTFLFSFQSFSRGYLGENEDQVIVFNPLANTVFTGTVPGYLADELTKLPGVSATSSEVLAPVITHNGKHLILRGVEDQFFMLQDVSLVEGRIGKLSLNECILGYRASRRIGVDVGDSLIVRSVLRSVVKEFTVTGVFRSDLPLDDEIIASINIGRVLAGLSFNRVNLIRASIIESSIDSDELNAVISTHELSVQTVNLGNREDWSILVELREPTNWVIERREVDVPGKTVFSLPYGEYVIGVGNQEKLVFLDEDKALSFDLNPEVKYLGILVLNSTTSAPLRNVEIMITNTLSSISEKHVSNKDGFIEAYLVKGEYVLSNEFDENIISVNLENDEDVVYSIGRYKTDVYIYDVETYSPVSNASIILKSINDEIISYTSFDGNTSFYLSEGSYNVSVRYLDLMEWKIVSVPVDSSVIFLLGEKEITHDLSLKVFWANTTAVPNAQISIESYIWSWQSSTDYNGRLVLRDLPEKEYLVEAWVGDVSKKISVTLDAEKSVQIILPTAVNFLVEDIRPEWFRYLPQQVVVRHSNEVFTSSMRVIVDIVVSVILVMGAVFTLSTVSSSLDIIANSINESKASIGVLRAIGANKTETFRVIGNRLIIFSGVTGLVGYFIGYGLMRLVSEYGLILFAGYSLPPRLNLLILSLSVIVSVLVTLFGVYRNLAILTDQPIMNNLKGLRKHEILYLPDTCILYPITAFLVPFIVRLIPEIIVWPHPIGWDTLTSYIPILDALRTGFEARALDIVKMRPFFWAIASIPYPLDSINPFKFFPVLLHGLLGVSAYYYGRTVFVSKIKALAAALLATVFFVSLRISWDLLANEMGLILVFTSLTQVRRGLNNWGETAFAFLTITATTLTHEAASIIFFVSAIPEAVHWSRKSEKAWLRYILVIIPPLLFFSYRLIIFDFPLISNALGDFRYPSSNYSELFASVVTVCLFSVVPLILLSVFGLKGELKAASAKAWLLGATLAAVSPIYSPRAAFTLWIRWAYMTVYPLSFFLVEGVGWFKRIKIKTRGQLYDFRAPITVLFSIAILIINFGFIASPPAPREYVSGVFGEEANWIKFFFPSSMQLSTVYPIEADEARALIFWLNGRASSQRDTVMIVDEVYRGYVTLYLDREKILVNDIGGTWYSDSAWTERLNQTSKQYHEQGFNIFILSGPIAPKNFDKVMESSAYTRLYKYIGN